MPHPHAAAVCCPRAACLCSRSVFFFFAVAFSLFSFLFSAIFFFMLYFVSDVAMAANFPCRQWQRPMTGSKIGNAKSSNDDGDSDVSCDGSSSSSSSSNSDWRECRGGSVRGANSICVKNTFSCCACFKYNTHTHTHLHSQKKQQQWIVLFLKARIKHICMYIYILYTYIVYVYILHSTEPGLG